jgi:hypothetical protein
MKSSRASGLVLAGAVGLAGLAVGASLAPVAASAATSTATAAVTERVTAIKNALAGLVKDGTITQSQADKVATTLDDPLPKDGGFGRHGGHGGHGGRGGIDLDTVAGVLGVSADELRTQLQSGKTLAQVAQDQNISQATLVDKLVAVEKARIAAAVKAGRITQARADAVTADLKARITQRVTSIRPMGGRGHHDREWGGRGTQGTPTPQTPDTSPSGTASSAT